ncbi:MAG: phosphatidate cytidylyltransferase [Nitriliruptoraceae bacterium]
MEAPTPSSAPRGMVGGRNLPVAIAVGVLLAAVFLAALFWRPEALTAVIVLLAGTAAVEVAQVLGGVGQRVLLVPLLLGIVGSVVGALLLGGSGQAIGMALLLVTAFLWLLVDRDRTEVTRTLGLTAFFGLWIGLFASYAPRLADRPEGAVVVLAVIGAVIVTDIGGYAFGVPFGRHKVVPSISPGKSWEGLVGGLAVAALLAALVLPRLGETFTPLTGALVALAAGGAGFLGDLVQSMVKRDLGVKDLGEVLPGHGGVLDRVDGILFALPVAFYGLALLT